MKPKNRELQKIAKKLESYCINSYLILDAVDKLYLAVFEDEKYEEVQEMIIQLKLESNDATWIAETCADHFNVNFDGGPLDDSDHWIWEFAAL